MYMYNYMPSIGEPFLTLDDLTENKNEIRHTEYTIFLVENKYNVPCHESKEIQF